MGYQGDNLFYLDPHFTRSAVVPVVPSEEGDADDEGGSPQINSNGKTFNFKKFELTRFGRCPAEEREKITSLEELDYFDSQFC